MADTLESIELQVKHSASGADAEISKITRSLSALGKTITSVLPKLSKLAGALDGVAGKNTPITFNDNSVAQFADSIKNVQRNVTNVNKATSSIGGGVRGMVDNLKKSSGPLKNFIGSLKRIAMYRFLRTIIKSITQGFSEGLKNAYHFSKGLNGSLAQALDSLSTKSQTMSNQMGAAFGALLQAIMPVVLQIIALITRLMQALSALFAAIGGGQYLIAKDVAKGWDEATGGAKEYKKTLLGFDEINRLDDNSGGGGGGGSDWANMFEEGQLPKWAQWIADHLELIKDLAIAIGAAIAAWKFADFLSDLFGLKFGLKELLGIAMAVGGAFLLVKGAIDAFTNGVNWDNLMEMIGGTALLAGGLALAFGRVAGGIGLVVGGLTLLITGITDWIKKGELTEESFWAIEAGVMALGGGIALLTGSWIPLLIAGVVALAFGIITHWEEIKEWTKKTWENIKQWCIDTWESIKEWAINTWETMKEKIAQATEQTKEKIVEIWEKIKRFFTETVPQIIEKVKNWFGELPGKIGYALGLALGEVISWGNDAAAWLDEKVPEIIGKVSDWFGELPGKIKEKWDQVMEKFSEWKDTATSWVSDNVPKIIDDIESWFKDLPSRLLKIGEDMLSSLWDGIQNSWTWVSGKISDIGTGISNAFSNFGSGFTKGLTTGLGGGGLLGGRLAASGGFMDSGEVFIAREAGPEMVGSIGGRTAVANNDQIVESVSIGVAEAVSSVLGSNSERPLRVQVFLDSREIRVGQNRLVRAMGV